MINTTNNKLKYIASFVWILGGVVLFVKSYSMLNLAQKLNPNYLYIILSLIIAFVIGMLKNRFIMSKFCKKNIDRIMNLKKPKVYQVYETYFVFMLILMILVGAFLSRVVIGNFIASLAVGIFDLSLSTALLTSSTNFFKKV